MFWLIDAMRLPSNCRLKKVSRILFERGWIWAVATAAPLLAAWLLSRLGIAPLLHYRFILSAALPLYLFAASLCGRLPSPKLQCTVAVATFAWLTAAQGSWNLWRAGDWIGSLRSEGWREAAEFLAGQVEEKTDALWCHSGLIEGLQATPPLSAMENEYLSYPLRACYQVAPRGNGLAIGGLVGDSRRWREQIAAGLRAGTRAGEGLDAPMRLEAGHIPPTSALPGAAERVWIIHRGPGWTLQRRLAVADLHHWPVEHPVREFGRISLVCIRRPQP